jgi:hypothetical protein
MSTPTWLPARLDRVTFPDKVALEAAAWTVFQNDFRIFPQFRGEAVRVSRVPHKARNDREHTYWHVVTEGEPEEARKTPMPDRLERVPWIKPLIENEACPLSDIKVWSNQRGGSTHICIWFDRLNYLVVLKQLSKNYLLKTAYMPESRRRQQLHKEYAAWKKKRGTDVNRALMHLPHGVDVTCST